MASSPKTVVEVLRKRTVVITLNMVNMVSILIVLKAQTLSGKR